MPAATMPPRPLPPARPSRRPALPPPGALAGAAVAVAGVVLGIGTLLWATSSSDADPAAAPPPAAEQARSPAGDSYVDEPAVALPEPDGAAAQAAEPDAPAPAQPPAPAPAPAPAPPPIPAPPAQQAEAAPAAPPAPPPVLVLNNSRISGLAEQAAARFEAEGWPVHDTGGLRGRIRATTVYYPPGEQAVAQEFARRFPGVQRVLPRLAGLPGAGLTVVVTRDFTA